MPVSFGSSPTTTSTAAPARKPVTTARERNRAIQPSRSSASRRNSAARHERDRRDELGGLRAADAGEEHGSARDRRERRARPRRDVPRRAEQRVDDRAGRRRVEPVLHRHARDARVAEILRDDHRRHREPGEHVAAQHRPVVARQPVDDRQQAAEAAARRVGHVSILSDAVERPAGRNGRAARRRPVGKSGRQTIAVTARCSGSGGRGCRGRRSA